MKEQELTNLLKAFDDRITQSSAASFQSLTELRMQKSVFALGKMRFKRILELIFTAMILLFLGSFLFSNRDNLSVAISAAILMFFLIIQIIGIINQLVLISDFDFAKSVTENQRILASLQTHIIAFLRLAILQFPFFLAYLILSFKVFFDFDIWANGNNTWLVANLILSVMFVPVSIWICRQISIVNLHRKWVKTIIESAGKEVFEAMEFLREIETFKND